MSGRIYVLVVQEADGSIVRMSTARHTREGREELEKQLRHCHGRAWIQTEQEVT